MPMAPKTDAEKAAKLREKAKDKSLPQPVRNQYLDDANKLEEKAAKKAGVNLAKGGAVPKKMAVGGMAEMMQKAQRELGQGATSNAVRSAMEAYKSNLKKQPAAQAATGMKPAATMTKASPVPAAAKPSAKQKTVAASNMRMAQQGGTPQQAMPPDFMTKRTAFAGPASAAGGTPQPAMTRQTMQQQKQASVAAQQAMMRPLGMPQQTAMPQQQAMEQQQAEAAQKLSMQQQKQQAEAAQKQAMAQQQATVKPMKANKGGMVRNKGVGASMKPHNVFSSKAKGK